MRKIAEYEEIKLILKKFVDEALTITTDIRQVVLYGSCARGDDTPESDIDVMVLIDCDEKEYNYLKHKFWSLAHKIGYEYDKLISVVVCRKAEYEEYADAMLYYQNIRKEGVVLYGRAA